MKLFLQSVLCIFTINAFATRPTTIPALREWTDGSGSFTLNAASRIVMDNANTARPSSTSSVFADDIKQLTGLTLPVISAANPSAGDIFLSLGSSGAQLGRYNKSRYNETEK